MAQLNGISDRIGEYITEKGCNVDVSQFYLDTNNCMPQNQYIPYTWTVTNTKSALEQVQEKLLNKVSDAVEKEDFKKAKELAKLIKELKEALK